MIWDTHMHTYFSGDSDAPARDMISRAVQLGLPGICITDHLDYDYPDDPELFLLDLPAYEEEIHALASEFDSQIEVRFGIELGLQPQLAARHREVTAAHPFDQVIGSVHVVHGIDPYYPEYYSGRKEQDAYREYFECILENIRAFDDFDTLGHLDYVVRYGPTGNKNYKYADYADIIDEILRLLVQKDKALEVNTGGLKYGLSEPNPCADIIRRFRELGGELITIGADAHTPAHIAFDLEKIPPILKDCGFGTYTVFKGRKPEFLVL